MRSDRRRSLVDEGGIEESESTILAEIIGPDLLIVLAVVLVVFGGSQLPRLARGLGAASHEFRKGLEEGVNADEEKTPAE